MGKSSLVIGLVIIVGLFSGCKKDDAGTNSTIIGAPLFQYPTAVGTTWIYSYGYFTGNQSPGPGSMESITGSCVWEVTSAATRPTGTLSIVKSTFQGRRVVTTYAGGAVISSDTTIIPESWTTFTIETQAEAIYFTWPGTLRLATNIPTSFWRALGKSGDSLLVSTNVGVGGGSMYADSIGLIWYSTGHSSMGSGFGESLNLINIFRP